MWRTRGDWSLVLLWKGLLAGILLLSSCDLSAIHQSSPGQHELTDDERLPLTFGPGEVVPGGTRNPSFGPSSVPGPQGGTAGTSAHIAPSGVGSSGAVYFVSSEECLSRLDALGVPYVAVENEALLTFAAPDSAGEDCQPYPAYEASI